MICISYDWLTLENQLRTIRSSELKEEAGYETHIVDQEFLPLLLPSHRGLCNSLTWLLTPLCSLPQHSSQSEPWNMGQTRSLCSRCSNGFVIHCKPVSLQWPVDRVAVPFFFLIVFHVALTHVVFGVPHMDWVWISDQDIFESKRGA